MIQVYNNYLTEYSSSLSRYSSAHKPKELKDIYSRIVSLNRHSAYYKLDLSKDKQFFSLTLKDAALTLSDKLKELSGVLLKPAVTSGVQSSDPSGVSAKLLFPEQNTFSEPISVQVHSLASPQVNRGLFVPSDTEGPAPGSYRFHIQTGDEDYEFSYKITGNSTNRELMNKLTDFINKSNISVRAEVEENSSAGISRMVLHSAETGVARDESLRFIIADSATPAPEFPGLVSYFGLDHVAQAPANARFSLNGAEKESARNEVLAGRDLALTLLRATDEPVKISPKTIGEQTVTGLQSFLDGYNTIIRLSQNGLPGNRRSARLQNELNHILSSDIGKLQSSGIHRGEDLTLSLESDTLQTSEAAKQLRELFEEPDGMLARLSRKMQDIALNPMEYVDKTIVTYPNTSRAGFNTPYNTSVYSGIMFNSYC